MHAVPAESDTRSLNQAQELTWYYLNLLLALPYPLAVFCQADGSLVAANNHFCDTFRLPKDHFLTDEQVGLCDRLRKKGQQIIKSDRIRIDTINGDSIQLTTSSGQYLPRATVDVSPCFYGDQECWLVATTAVPGQNRSGDDSAEERISYRDLVENLNDIVYTTDQNAVVTYVSPNIARLSGFAPDEVIGRSFVEFVHPEDLTARMAQFLKILGGENQATEYRLFTKTGEIKWIRTSARPVVKQDKVIGVQGILVDITDRKAIEDALKLSEEKYRLLVQHAKDAIFVIQGEHIRYMNPRASEVLGYTCSCIAEKPFIEFVHPDDRSMILDRYQRRLRGEKLSDNVCFRIINKDGEARDVELNAVLISWEEKPAVLNFLRDITVQNLMENQLRNAQKMEALGTLSGGIAHNFNNLLMAINGNISLACAGLDQSSPVRKYLEKIDKLVESGAKLTKQLLDYARGGSCRANKVDLNALIEDVAETISAMKKPIQIHQNLTKDLPSLKADLGQIEQVLLNLLLNAADAMPKGGDVFIETSSVKGSRAKAGVALSHDQRYVLLTVSDCGSGIPETILDRIFEPFFTTKGLDRGTGLGLSTAYGIVKNHNGEITVESKINQGTRFFIYLPTDTEDSANSVPNQIAEDITGRATVLLVEDDQQVLETSAHLLQLLGYGVIKAEDGSIALEKFKENWQQIELVVLDLILPVISGRDLYHKLKEINPDVKVLLSSGFGVAGQAEELMREGCCGFIQKPYHIKQLSSKMMKILAPA